MTTPAELLSLDEARDELGTSAIALVEAVACSPAKLTRLTRLLHGKGTARGLPLGGAEAVKTHRAVVRQVLATDHSWILDEQIEGALSYAVCLGGHETRALAA
ncbi:MAG: hypothetical protein M3011_12275 [Actinomycetota bacterium]|nr:hypothetical protein [Actinomycetota bacterium]